MKQVTGNNDSKTIYMVSVRPALDGHSFSEPELRGDYSGDGPVEVRLLTEKTILVPTEMFEPDDAEALFAASGIALAPGERIVNSAPCDGVVALMALGSRESDLIDEKIGCRALYSTPLLEQKEVAEPTVWILHLGGLLYCKVYEHGLRLAEVIPAPGEEDVLYFMTRLRTQFNLHEYEFRSSGPDAKSLCKAVKRLFKRTVCE